MILDQSIVDMYERSRTKVFVEELQKEVSDLEGLCDRVNPEKGDYYQVPYSGSTEMGFRTQRYEQIEASELKYGRRGMRPVLMEKWLKMSTDDELFLQNLPINLTQMAKELSKAASRMKDEILMGTCRSTAADATKGDYIVRTATTIEADAEDGSPYKAGTTSGIFGDVYVGRFGDSHVSLTNQPIVDASDTPITEYTDYTAASVLNLKKTNVIPVNYVKSGTPAVSGFTLEKFLTARQALKARYAKGTICLALTHRQALDMLTDEKLQNKDYGFNILNSDVLGNILGVKILVTDTVPLVNVGSAGTPKWVRACPMWITDDIMYGVWQDAKFQIRQPSMYVDKIITGVTFGMGAARKREETVVCIHCDEGIAE